ncbi:hypothetical protein [Maridesulfovibrio sp.]|uniref:hypothetical protein n=1 Tax=unclassified Maridesulfovibrio TaxID=2794999 RepID=UPI003AFF6D1A
MIKLMKTMFLVAAMLCFITGSAFAQCTSCDFNAQGSALIPHIKGYRTGGSGSFYTRLHLSNITDCSIQCKITLYDQNGADASNLGSYYTVASNNTWQWAGDGGTALTLPPHSTVIFEFTKDAIPDKIIGYGNIKWNSSNGKLQKAMLGSARYNETATSMAMGGTVYLNNGEPF